MYGKILIALMSSFFLWACAKGYTASDVKQGAEEDIQQIDDRFDQDVHGTKKMLKDADKDVRDWVDDDKVSK